MMLLIAILVLSSIILPSVNSLGEFKQLEQGYITVNISNNTLSMLLFKKPSGQQEYIKRVVTVASTGNTLNISCIRSLSIKVPKASYSSITLKYEVKPVDDKYRILGFILINTMNTNMSIYFMGLITGSKAKINATCTMTLNVTGKPDKRKILVDISDVNKLNNKLKELGLEFITLTNVNITIVGKSATIKLRGFLDLNKALKSKNNIVKLMSYNLFDTNTTLIFLALGKHKDRVHTAIYTITTSGEAMNLTSISTIILHDTSLQEVQAILHLVLGRELLLDIPVDFPILHTQTIGVIHYINRENLSVEGLMTTPITILLPKGVDVEGLPSIIRKIIEKTSIQWSLPVMLKLQIEDKVFNIRGGTKIKGLIGCNETTALLLPEGVSELDKLVIIPRKELEELKTIEQVLLVALIVSSVAVALSVYMVFIRRRARGK